MINKNPTLILLLVSMLLNMFLIGFVVSYLLVKRGPPPPPPMQPPFSPFHMAKVDISPEGQEIVELILKKQNHPTQNSFHTMERSIMSAQKLLTAPELDLEALDDIHKEMLSHGDSAKQHFSILVREIAVKLSSEDRVMFFKHTLPPHGSHLRKKSRHRKKVP